MHWEPGLVLSVVAIFLTLVGWLVRLVIRPCRLTGYGVVRVSSGIAPAGAELMNKGGLAKPLHTNLAIRKRHSHIILKLSRMPSAWFPVTTDAFMYADSWDLKGYRARLKTGLNLRCRFWMWPKRASLQMRIFPDEPERYWELLAWISMGRAWIWPRREFRIEPGAVYVDIDPSLPQRPVEAYIDSKGKLTIPPGGIRIEIEVDE